MAGPGPGTRDSTLNLVQDQVLWSSSAPVKDPGQLIMGPAENERELQKPDNDNAAFCSAFIQLQTTGHSLKMGATVLGIENRDGGSLFLRSLHGWGGGG